MSPTYPDPLAHPIPLLRKFFPRRAPGPGPGTGKASAGRGPLDDGRGRRLLKYLRRDAPAARPGASYRVRRSYPAGLPVSPGRSRGIRRFADQ